MNLHEYQGKELLQKFDIDIQQGILVSDVKQALNAAKKLYKITNTKIWIIKAQIHAGGRGKNGGIIIVKHIKDIEKKVSELLGNIIYTPQTGKKGKVINYVLISEDVYYLGEHIPKEYYISIMFNRDDGNDMIIYSSEGGIDIEDTLKKTPEKIYIEYINPILGIQPFQIRKIAFNLNLNKIAFHNFIKLIYNFYKCYKQSDALLFEINPLLKNSNNKFIAVDAKVIIDDNAIFRHKNIIYDDKESNPIELEAYNAGLKFIKLDGNVACIVNGAGLAMATMDMIKISGGYPANFLDIGGTADTKRVEKACQIILKDKNVKIILINIFGGIVRCDQVVQGIINIKKYYKYMPPIIMRLQGTNAELAKKIIYENKLTIHLVNNMYEASKIMNNIL